MPFSLQVMFIAAFEAGILATLLGLYIKTRPRKPRQKRRSTTVIGLMRSGATKSELRRYEAARRRKERFIAKDIATTAQRLNGFSWIK